MSGRGGGPRGGGAGRMQRQSSGGGDTSKRKRGSMTIFLQSLAYMWPKDSWLLRIDFVMSLLSLLAANLCDIATPVALKYAVNQLAEERTFPWEAILAYGGLRFTANLFQQLRDIFFATVSSHTERQAALDTFRQLQALSLAFHLKRETGAILRSVSRGSQSFATLCRIALFQFIPVVFSVSAVSIYLLIFYEWQFAALTTGVIFVYTAFTILTTKWRDQFRKIMNEKDNEYNQKAIDALLNFEAVKYYNAEKHEERRFDKALRDYTAANISVQRSLAILNLGQNLIISAGIILAMWIAGHAVVDGKLAVGDFVMLQGFILQLYQPLGFLGTYYRMIRQAIVDVESMFDLFEEERDVVDKLNAPEIQVQHGEIRFEDVKFAYPSGADKGSKDTSLSPPVLKGISFTIKPGQHVAIVGSSGAGKSTILRLLYRFFELQSGKIFIDGQNITEVTQSSLRSNIAVVPQDTTLFNDTIGYNIGYGIVGRRPSGATMDEKIDAAKKAQIYQHIITQKDGFDAKVGERGLRLSGGEKQRVAIARAILKAPKIMVFDEATSSLDSETEAQIVDELYELSHGFTSLTIAHRLSTTMDCDLILVLDKGRVREQGTHGELLQHDGMYAQMWRRQERSRQLQQSLTEIQKAEAANGIQRSPSPAPPAGSDNNGNSHEKSSSVVITVDDSEDTSSTKKSDSSTTLQVPAQQKTKNQNKKNAAKQKQVAASKSNGNNAAAALTEPLLGDDAGSSDDEEDDDANSSAAKV